MVVADCVTGATVRIAPSEALNADLNMALNPGRGETPKACLNVSLNVSLNLALAKTPRSAKQDGFPSRCAPFGVFCLR